MSDTPPAEQQPVESEPVQPQIPEPVIGEHSSSVATILGDRQQLMESANKLIELMVTRQVWPMTNSSIPSEPLELSRVEQRAYDQALEFMANQFRQGPQEPKFYVCNVTTKGPTKPS